MSASSRLCKTGVIGSVVVAICCATPVLIVPLGFIGLGAVTGYLDYVLFPALAVFIGITIYAVVRRQRGACDDICATKKTDGRNARWQTEHVSHCGLKG